MRFIIDKSICYIYFCYISFFNFTITCCKFDIVAIVIVYYYDYCFASDVLMCCAAVVHFFSHHTTYSYNVFIQLYDWNIYTSRSDNKIKMYKHTKNQQTNKGASVRASERTRNENTIGWFTSDHIISYDSLTCVSTEEHVEHFEPKSKCVFDRERERESNMHCILYIYKRRFEPLRLSSSHRTYHGVLRISTENSVDLFGKILLVIISFSR